MALLSSLTGDQRVLLDRVCSFVYYPHNDRPPSILLPYSLGFYECHTAPGFSREDPVYVAGVEFVHDHPGTAYAPPAPSWGEFGWGMVQSFCMAFAFGCSPGTVSRLLTPLRLVEAVPEEWSLAVVEATGNLGLAAALRLPSLAAS